ncbi:MAG TPA: right-handed parallel beta-helix repeat-containing protein [Polyangiaceae bacterium]|nr:right-handed parallel beta-helix repeat-containing protein [Polyangiaceae bacterium]
MTAEQRIDGSSRFALGGRMLCRAALLLPMGCVIWTLGSCEPDRTIRVSVLTDGGKDSLRAAFDRINAERPEPARATVIELGAGTYELTLCGVDDTNASGDLDLTTDLPVSLLARTDGVVIRQTCAGERVLDAHRSGRLTLIGVTITGGALIASDPSQPARGGGLRAQGDVTLNRATFTSNVATGTSAFGGGLYVGGSLHAWQATLSANRASSFAPPSGGPAGTSEGGGAFVEGAITLIDGSVENNSAVGGPGSATGGPGDARGGGLAQAAASSAPVSVTATTFLSNSAQGGYIPGNGNGGAATGGALAAAGPLAATNVTATQNAALGGGSSAPIGTFPPPAAFVVVAGGSARGGALSTSGSASIVTSQFSGNRVATSHRGTTSIRTAPDPTFFCRSTSAPSNPGAALGGAVWVGRSAALTGGSYSQNTTTSGVLLVNTCTGSSCTFSFPPCADSPGVFLVSRGGAVAAEGALAVDGGEYAGNGAQADGNRAPDGAAISGLQDATITAGHIHDSQGIGSALSVTGRLQLSETQVLGNAGSGVDAGFIEAKNVTIANNQARGIGGAEVTLVNTSVVGNGEFGVVAGSALKLRHCTIADNWINLNAPRLSSHGSAVIGREGAQNCWVSDAVTVSSYNWFSDDSCGLAGAGDHQENAAFLLGPLADNGGTILTRAPSLPSVLVDLIPAASCPETTDARGISRPQGAACDVGAVELTQ